MKKFTIKKEKFLQWYFEDGQDQENKSIKKELAAKAVEGLFEKGEFKITTEDVFSLCNKNAIRLSYLEEFEDDGLNHDKELSDLGEEYTLQLID